MSDILQQMMKDAGAESAPSAQPSIMDTMAADASHPMQDAPTQPVADVPFGQRLNAGIADIPHQLGLTARYGLEGLGSLADTLDSPLRVPFGIPAGVGSRLSNSLGLPTPNTPTQRIVGDASRMVASGGGLMGLAGKAAPILTGSAQKMAELLASNPSQQIASAAAGGSAGGYTRETGGDGLSQFIASLAAGVAAPFAMSGAQKLGNLLSGLAANTEQATQLDLKINNALQDHGMTLGDLPPHVQNGIRNDVSEALKINPDLSPDALRRLTDYKLIGATPTAATLTLDPAMISQQKNLAKMGINSKDVAAQQLGRVENNNNRQLISALNNVGASTADDALAGGQKIIGALSAKNDAAQSLINQAYEQAKATTGRDIALDPSYFANKANDMLDSSLLGGKLPGDVRNLLNNAATGKMPLTVDTAEQLKTRIGELQRASMDGAERKALGLVRQTLDETPLLNDGAGMGQASIDAFNKARALNRSWMNTVEDTPALQAVRDGIQPDKFVQQFIIGGGSKANVADLQALQDAVKNNPEALSAVKEQIAASLKKAALNGSADEVGNFSQSNYNKALAAIGDRKLSMFFPSDELQQLKAIGRVASYEQFQPKGAAINNSNTSGTMMANLLDRVGSSSMLSKIPFGNAIATPANNISIGMQSKAALSVQQALAKKLLEQGGKSSSLMISPALLMGAGN